MRMLEKVFGTHSERDFKIINPVVDRIESLRSEMVELSDEKLQEKTNEFKERIASGTKLDDILPEAYAVVREAARRTTGLEPYRVQLIAAVIIHQG